MLPCSFQHLVASSFLLVAASPQPSPLVCHHLFPFLPRTITATHSVWTHWHLYDLILTNYSCKTLFPCKFNRSQESRVDLNVTWFNLKYHLSPSCSVQGPLCSSVDSGSLCPLLELILLTQPMLDLPSLEIAPIKVTINFVSCSMIEDTKFTSSLMNEWVILSQWTEEKTIKKIIITQAQTDVIALSKWKILNWNAVHKSHHSMQWLLGSPRQLIDLVKGYGLTRGCVRVFESPHLLP